MAENYVDGQCISCGRTVRVYFYEEDAVGLHESSPESFLEVALDEDLYCDICDPFGTKTEHAMREKSGS